MSLAKASLEQRNILLTTENIKEQFGDCLSLIRFPLMALSDLLKCFDDYPTLLPPDQMIDIIKYADTKTPLTVASHFNCNKRLGAEYVIPFEKVSTADQNDTSSLRMQWKMNKSMRYFVTLKVYIEDPWYRVSKVDIVVKINDIAIHSESLVLTGDDDERLVQLKEPICFNKLNDEVRMVIELSRYSERCLSSFSTNNVLPTGLHFHPNEPSENSFVTEIHLKETL